MTIRKKEWKEIFERKANRDNVLKGGCFKLAFVSLLRSISAGNRNATATQRNATAFEQNNLKTLT